MMHSPGRPTTLTVSVSSLPNIEINYSKPNEVSEQNCSNMWTCKSTDSNEFEKLLVQLGNNSSTPVTPTSFLNPRHITEDQELFADKFSNTLNKLKAEHEGWSDVRNNERNGGIVNQECRPKSNTLPPVSYLTAHISSIGNSTPFVDVDTVETEDQDVGCITDADAHSPELVSAHSISYTSTSTLSWSPPLSTRRSPETNLVNSYTTKDNTALLPTILTIASSLKEPYCDFHSLSKSRDSFESNKMLYSSRPFTDSVDVVSSPTVTASVETGTLQTLLLRYTPPDTNTSAPSSGSSGNGLLASLTPVHSCSGTMSSSDSTSALELRGPIELFSILQADADVLNSSESSLMPSVASRNDRNGSFSNEDELKIQPPVLIPCCEVVTKSAITRLLTEGSSNTTPMSATNTSTFFPHPCTFGHVQQSTALDSTQNHSLQTVAADSYISTTAARAAIISMMTIDDSVEPQPNINNPNISTNNMSTVSTDMNKLTNESQLRALQVTGIVSPIQPVSSFTHSVTTNPTSIHGNIQQTTSSVTSLENCSRVLPQMTSVPINPKRTKRSVVNYKSSVHSSELSIKSDIRCDTLQRSPVIQPDNSINSMIGDYSIMKRARSAHSTIVPVTSIFEPLTDVPSLPSYHITMDSDTLLGTVVTLGSTISFPSGLPSTVVFSHPVPAMQLSSNNTNDSHQADLFDSESNHSGDSIDRSTTITAEHMSCVRGSPPSSSLDTISHGGHSDLKLERKRARNRVAARRCRERKISLIRSLEIQVAERDAVVKQLEEVLTRYRAESERLRAHMEMLCASYPSLKTELCHFPFLFQSACTVRSDNIRSHHISKLPVSAKQRTDGQRADFAVARHIS